MWPILSQQTEAGPPSEDKDVWEDEDEDEDEDEEQNIEGNDGTLIDVTTFWFNYNVFNMFNDSVNGCVFNEI